MNDTTQRAALSRRRIGRLWRGGLWILIAAFVAVISYGLLVLAGR